MRPLPCPEAYGVTGGSESGFASHADARFFRPALGELVVQLEHGQALAAFRIVGRADSDGFLAGGGVDGRALQVGAVALELEIYFRHSGTIRRFGHAFSHSMSSTRRGSPGKAARAASRVAIA